MGCEKKIGGGSGWRVCVGGRGERRRREERKEKKERTGQREEKKTHHIFDCIGRREKKKKTLFLRLLLRLPAVSITREKERHGGRETQRFVHVRAAASRCRRRFVPDERSVFVATAAAAATPSTSPSSSSSTSSEPRLCRRHAGLLPASSTTASPFLPAAVVDGRRALLDAALALPVRLAFSTFPVDNRGVPAAVPAAAVPGGEEVVDRQPDDVDHRHHDSDRHRGDGADDGGLGGAPRRREQHRVRLARLTERFFFFFAFEEMKTIVIRASNQSTVDTNDDLVHLSLRRDGGGVRVGESRSNNNKKDFFSSRRGRDRERESSEQEDEKGKK